MRSYVEQRDLLSVRQSARLRLCVCVLSPRSAYPGCLGVFFG